MRVLADYALDRAAHLRLEEISASIMKVFDAAGYARIALPLLQPANLYLDMAGEDMRERMFVFEDPGGTELCLRADLTIPVCRAVIDNRAIKLPARVSCAGPIFRFDTDAAAPTELLQAGIECLGVTDTLAADAETLSLARRALQAAGLGPLEVELGDLALFAGLIEDLALDPIWARRLTYAFRHPSLLRPTLDGMRAGARPKAKAFEIDFARAGKSEAERFVQDRLGLADGESASGRAAMEIAERLIDRAKEAEAPLPGARELDAIEAFIAVSGPAEESLRRLKALGLGASFAKGLARFKDCAERVRKALGLGDTLTVSATLGRSFVYYTGFVFELRAPGIAEPVAAGGRYDRLMSDLGAKGRVPAVGCALWPERLLAAGGKGHG